MITCTVAATTLKQTNKLPAEQSQSCIQPPPFSVKHIVSHTPNYKHIVSHTQMASGNLLSKYGQMVRRSLQVWLHRCSFVCNVAKHSK
jgi:hypothetical protein